MRKSSTSLMRTAVWVVGISLLILLIGVTAVFLFMRGELTLVPPADNTWIGVVTKEVSLGKIPPGMDPRLISVSPDLRHAAYAAERGKKKLVVMDGMEGKEYDGIGKTVMQGIWGAIFSPDSRRVAYEAQRGGKGFVVVEGVEGKEYDQTNWPTFSPDSRRVAYEARRGKKWFVVVDGVEGKEYDTSLAQTHIPWTRTQVVFDSPDALHGLALRNSEILRVEITIVGKQP